MIDEPPLQARIMKRVFSDNETNDITEITQAKDAMEEPAKKKQQVAASPRVRCSATTATVETKRKKLTGTKGRQKTRPTGDYNH
ncbi:hypothetical protein M422DRAFT_268115 [Sphaerobolus stellatus SS14]|uniref:Uncharacterized protein n=1 Tax=Sphaerobolus stellatus (strain SS14) TaxID=990650 RepID=A0A0C9UYA0_SPHS4|nr:hypothetical protein M422DRAFT_268115 [Sphaerobolus stellatus SS14]